MSSSALTLTAFAKVNLYLRVLGQRDDGYHEISTFLQTISLHDRLTIEATEEPTFTLWCDDPSLPRDSDNLVYRAAETLQQRFASGKGARIRLEKSIPAEAGLGGGSSDAAVTLIALAHLWKLEVSAAELHEIAGTLGADVPFFFYGGTAQGTGVGATISPITDLQPEILLILKPNAGVSTATAYEALNSHSLTSGGQEIILCGSFRDPVFDNITRATVINDFEAVVYDLVPEVARAKVALETAGAKMALLAGSGAAVYGFFDNEDAQRRAIQAIELEPGWRVFPCTTVTRDQFRNAMGPAASVLTRFDNA